MSDQFFQQGDKVMQVLDEEGFIIQYGLGRDSAKTEKGKVYCVSEFISNLFFVCNAVRFVGVEMPSSESYFIAKCYRKVEEIKLCIKAVETIKQPNELVEMK